MAHVLEFNGRLTRSDKRPANPGTYDLGFALHASVGDDEPVWSENARGVDVVPGGFFRVVLGRSQPLSGELFAEGPQWLAVRVIRGRQMEEETGPRVPVAGGQLLLWERVDRIEGRMGEGDVGERLQGLVDELRERLESLESEVEDSDLSPRLAELDQRLSALDGEEGRVTHIEDELEDLIGPEGDVVDLNERMDLIEGKEPHLLAQLRARVSEAERERVKTLRNELDHAQAELRSLKAGFAALQDLIAKLQAAPAPSPDAVGAVSRQGDVMTGGLTINRGGLEVLSGGVTCRGATVNSLEASVQVKAPKVIADALELRGDMTVDNSHRALQIRLIEGRQGSSRKDGALHLNGRSGGEVLVGTPEEAKGMQIHGPVTGGSFGADGAGLAQAFDVYGSIEPGQVACMRPDGTKVEFSKGVGDRALIGVCVEQAGLSVGGTTVGGRALVVLQGIAEVRAEGPLQVGTLLTSGPDGVARAADPDGPAGAVLGKAMAPLGEGTGTVAVLVNVR